MDKGNKEEYFSLPGENKISGSIWTFRYSVEGCILHHEPISSCYAFGILNAINGYKQLGNEKKKEWADYLRSFRE